MNCVRKRTARSFIYIVEQYLYSYIFALINLKFYTYITFMSYLYHIYMYTTKFEIKFFFNRPKSNCKNEKSLIQKQMHNTKFFDIAKILDHGEKSKFIKK